MSERRAGHRMKEKEVCLPFPKNQKKTVNIDMTTTKKEIFGKLIFHNYLPVIDKSKY